MYLSHVGSDFKSAPVWTSASPNPELRSRRTRLGTRLPARPAWRKSRSTAALACLPLADSRRIARFPRAARIEATRSNPAGILATPMM